MAEVVFHLDIHAEDDGSYWGEVRELPGCFASGFSMDELLEAAFEAMQLCLPDGVKLGDPKWSDADDAKARGKKSKPRPESRHLLVCA